MAQLTNRRIAILAADGFEQIELTSPLKHLVKHGALVDIVSLRPGCIMGENIMVPGKKMRVSKTIFTAKAEHYDGLYIPGGLHSPDFLRQSERVLEFVRDFERAGKPIAAICHGPWVLISAGIVEGRRIACWAGIKDDLINAGGIYVDKAVVKDDNLITSRDPKDLPSFNRELTNHFSLDETASERALPIPIEKLAIGGAIAIAAFAGLKQLINGQNQSSAHQTMR